MNAHNMVSSDSMARDFSSALHNANHNQSRSYKDSASSYERNVSSLLSQIQDDGPAHDDFSQAEKDVYLKSAAQGGYAQGNHKVNNDSNTAKQLNTELSELSSPSAKTPGVAMSATKKKNILVIPLIAALFAVVMMSLFMFEMDARISQFEEALATFEDSAEDSMDYQESNLTPKLSRMNKKLQSIKDEMLSVKSDYMKSDRQYSALIANQVSPQSLEIEALRGDVSAVKNELLGLQSEFEAVNKKHIAANELKPSTTTVIASNGWVVNLVSLKNKTQAENVVKQLHEAGLAPEIQKTVVNGGLVYRLSVGGFDTRSDAESFIHVASKQYGMKNGWVRKS